MWSDEEIDGAFRRLAPPEPEPEPFPLDAWLRLENQLDKAALEQQFRQRLWKYFAGEVAVVALLALAWLWWPSASKPEGLTTKNQAQPARLAARSSTGQAAHTTAPELQSAAPNSAGLVASSPALNASPGAARQDAPATAAAAAPAAQPLANGRPVSVSNPAAYTPSTGRSVASSPRDTTAERTEGRTRRLPLLGALASRQRATRTPLAPASEARASTQPPYAAATSQLAGNGQQRITKNRAGRSGLTEVGALGVSAVRGSMAGSEPRAAKLPGELNGARPGFAAAKSGATQTAATQTATPQGTTEPVAAEKTTRSATTAAAQEPTATSGANQAAGSAQATHPAPAGPEPELTPQPVALLAAAAPPLPAALASLPLPAPEPQPKELRQPRLYLGLVGAPDVSTVKMADYQSPRANLGLTLEYRLFSRLRVSTGVLRGTKAYRARKNDYNWDYYPTANTYNFEWVDASCTIVDVPLNLRYDVLARPRYQVFGAAGLSSLFMQRENYAFDYKYYNTPYRWQREYVNANQHWFSVLNLSLGYERNLGRHWRLQAEPYVKLPLGGVGAGKVRLASGGVFFGLKYGF